MRAIAVVALLACSSPKDTPKETPMHDPELAAQKITALSTSQPAQFGQSLVAHTNPGASAFSTLAKDVVRWKGKTETDVQPLRIYLGPWQPQPNIPTAGIPPAGVTYAPPTPWQTPAPAQYDAFLFGSVFARVSFGGGGVQYQAFVDWPPRGLLFQVSTHYVQVDAVGTFEVPAGSDTKLPRFLAHLAVEPGGGDSVQPGTYTYPPRDFNPDAGAPAVFMQVPPFARAVRPILQQQFALNTGVLAYIVTELGSPAGNILNQWVLDTANLDSFNTDDLPLSGLARDVQIQAWGGALPPGGAAATTINVGAIFLLDL